MHVTEAWARSRHAGCQRRAKGVCSRPVCRPVSLAFVCHFGSPCLMCRPIPAEGNGDSPPSRTLSIGSFFSLRSLRTCDFSCAVALCLPWPLYTSGETDWQIQPTPKGRRKTWTHTNKARSLTTTQQLKPRLFQPAGFLWLRGCGLFRAGGLVSCLSVVGVLAVMSSILRSCRVIQCVMPLTICTRAALMISEMFVLPLRLSALGRALLQKPFNRT